MLIDQTKPIPTASDSLLLFESSLQDLLPKLLDTSIGQALSSLNTMSNIVDRGWQKNMEDVHRAIDGIAVLMRARMSNQLIEEAPTRLREENNTMEKALREAQARLSAVQAEKEMRIEHFERQERKYEDHLRELETALSAREKQLDRLKEELLLRATTMDQEQKAAAQSHLNLTNERQILIGAMEAELSILKVQTQQYIQERGQLQLALGNAHQSALDLQDDHHVQKGVLREASAKLEGKVELLERQLEFQVCALHVIFICQLVSI